MVKGKKRRKKKSHRLSIVCLFGVTPSRAKDWRSVKDEFAARNLISAFNHIELSNRGKKLYLEEEGILRTTSSIRFAAIFFFFGTIKRRQGERKKKLVQRFSAHHQMRSPTYWSLSFHFFFSSFVNFCIFRRYDDCVNAQDLCAFLCSLHKIV